MLISVCVRNVFISYSIDSLGWNIDLLDVVRGRSMSS